MVAGEVAGVAGQSEVDCPMPRRLHDGRLHVDEALTRRLLAAQLPHLADLPLLEVHSTGTVNVIYRLGDDLSLRLPILPAWVDPHEGATLAVLGAAGLPLSTPVEGAPTDRLLPLPRGRSTDGCPAHRGT